VLVLGVETSCDETAAAVVEDGRLVRANVVASQIATHALYGGVVPEVASRQHVATIVPVLERAVADAGISFRELDAIAVTAGPGLVGALLVGVETAKALAFALGKPLIAVNHLAGHLAAAFIVEGDATPPSYPHLALLVSGGHTALIRIDGPGQTLLLGSTRDDAAGEAFDKVAKLLGLPYPGGPHVERLAGESGGTSANPFRFARPMLRRNQQADDPDYYDFSFSGLKTAVLNAVKSADLAADRAAIARAFQDALVETLVEKTARAAEQFGRDRVVLGGGVACNRTLARAMRDRVQVLDARKWQKARMTNEAVGRRPRALS
jgi:N6-L-threonylcarbamoyladenine synthase